MKISIVTVVYNRVDRIEAAIQSVLSQKYPLVEYIVVDGNSTDGTKSVIEKYTNSGIAKYISEPDKGIYNALNKGIKLATGDVVGILHSDDVFMNSEVLDNIANEFLADPTLEGVYGDVCFVSKKSDSKIMRYFSSASFAVSKFSSGFMPAHPSFFCRRSCFNKYGNYREDMKISADFDLLLRFLYVGKMRVKYIPCCTTKMTMGGASTSGFKSIVRINKEFRKALIENGVKTSYFKLYLRYASKVKEFVNKRG
jgi:glycosyltransferase involved in cell wall biosynthesis